MKRKGKAWLTVLLGIVVIAAACFEMYRLIGRAEWKEQRAAVERAYAESILYTASRVEPFNGESSYMIVYGKDKLDKDMLVWVGDKGVHVEYAADGITKEQAAEKVTARDPSHDVIRTKAGKLGDDYVWEVFYKKNENGKTHYYYDYYRFADGFYIDTYNLTLD